MEDVLLLLRFNCPSPSCSYQAASWDSLEKHTLSVHGAVLCHLCRRQLSRFAHEQVLYPPHLLPLHDPSRVPRGHRKPKVRSEKEEDMVNGWGPPHPMCEVGPDKEVGFALVLELIARETFPSSATRRSFRPTSCSSTCDTSTRNVSFAKKWASVMSSGLFSERGVRDRSADSQAPPLSAFTTTHSWPRISRESSIERCHAKHRN